MRIHLPDYSCLSCTFYIECQDPDKSAVHSCKDFAHYAVQTKSPLGELLTAGKNQEEEQVVEYSKSHTKRWKAKAQESPVLYADDFDIYSLIENAVAQGMSSPIDIKIDDSSLPKAPNFYVFATSEKYLNIVPYVMQVIIATFVFAECCYECSDLQWMYYDVAVDDSLLKFEQKVALLENGVCPHCKKTRSYFYKRDLINCYQEMAICAGQRCVVGDTSILTSDGLMDIGEYDCNRPFGFSTLYLPVYNGDTVESTSDYYKGRPELVNDIVLNTGHWLSCTDDHPIWTTDRFVLSKNMRVGETVKLKYGTRIFGDKTVELRSLINFDKLSSAFVGMETHLPLSVFTVLGVIVGKRDKNYDKEVHLYCNHTLCRLVGKDNVKENGFEVNSTHDSLLQELLGYKNEIAVPLCVRQGPRDFHVTFLCGLFESADFGKRCIAFSSQSKTLIRQVSAMLLNLGIWHTIRHGVDFTIEITGSFVQIFANDIGALGSTQRAALCKLLKVLQHGTKTVPRSTRNKFLRFARKSVLCLNQFTSRVDSTGKKTNDRNMLTVELSLKDKLTAAKIRHICQTLSVYRNRLSIPLQDRLQFWTRLTDEQNVYFASVKSIVRSEKKVVVFDFTLPESHRFWTNGCISSNSGKSSLVAMMAVYHTHRILKMPKPASTYGLLPNSLLHGTFSALTFSQARDSLWEPYFNYITSSPWFIDAHSLYASHQDKYGEELFKLRDTFVYYRHKGLVFSPAPSDRRTMRGRCLTGGAIVNTNNGFLQLREFVFYTRQVHDMTIDSHLGRQTLSHTYKDKSSVMRIITHNGFVLSGTPEHPLLVLKPDLTYSWVFLSELRVGDWILSKTHLNSPKFGNNAVDSEVVVLLGLHIACGNGLSFREEYADKLRFVVDKFGEICLTNDFCAANFEPLGYSVNQICKQIPIGIRTASKEAMLAFFRAYFSCVYTVHDASIFVTIDNITLASQVHVLLFHAYDVLGSLLKQDDGKVLIYFVGEDAKQFAKLFLSSSLFTVGVDRNSQHRQVPFIASEVKDYVTDILLDGDLTNDLLPEHVVYSAEFLNSLTKLSRFGNIERVVNFVTNKAHYERVVSVGTLATDQIVYDVSVVDSHAFTANCLTSHNTRIFACITGDVKIATSRGLVSMENICVGDRVCLGGDKTALVSKHVSTGVKRVWRVILKSGHVLTCSSDHELLVYARADNKFIKKKVSDLKSFPLFAEAGIVYSLQSPQVSFPAELPLPYIFSEPPVQAKTFFQSLLSTLLPSISTPKPYIGNKTHFVLPTKMTPDLASILGYLVANGSVDVKTNGIIFECEDNKKYRQYKACFKRVFNISPISSAHSYPKGTVYVCMTYYAEIVGFLRHCGLNFQPGVPWSILQAPKDCVVSFLQTLYKCIGQSKSDTVAFGFTNKLLLLHIQQLLQQLGVPSKLETRVTCRRTKLKYGKLRENAHYLRIYESHIPQFMFEVGLSFMPKKVVRNLAWCQTTSRAHYATSPIADIVATTVEEVMYDMTVDCPDHVYTANGIVVGNSCDEIAYFDHEAGSKKIRISAHEVYIALERSLLTVRTAATRLIENGHNDVPTAYFCNISSPSSFQDMIMTLVRQSEGSSKTFGLSRATWEMNPFIKEDDLAEEFRKDPMAAMRDYGAQPPLSARPFITNQNFLMKAMTTKRNGISLSFSNDRYADGAMMRYGIATYVKPSLYPSCVAIDGGSCITGDSFLYTTNGILSVKEVAANASLESGWVKVDLPVASAHGVATASSWICSGYQVVYSTTTWSGHCIKSTRNHKHKVFRSGELVWVEVSDMEIGDLLCIPTINFVRSEQYVADTGFVVNEELSFVIGALLSTGAVSGSIVQIYSDNAAYLDKVLDCCNSLWKAEMWTSTKDIKAPISKSLTLNIDCPELRKILVDWKLNKNTAFVQKSIPKFILKADSKSQFAFLAAYVEGNGNIAKNTLCISIWSRSDILLRHVQAMLGSHGIIGNILYKKNSIKTLSTRDAVLLYENIAKWLTFSASSHYSVESAEYKAEVWRYREYGFPSDFIVHFVRGRATKDGYYAEDGVIIKDDCVEDYLNKVGNRFLYHAFHDGEYDNLLTFIGKLSRSKLEQLLELFALNYYYSPIVSIERCSRRELVYDLSMEDKMEPSFVANGVLTHNSNNSFSIVSAHRTPHGQIQVDLIAEIIPLPKIPLNHSKIFDNVVIPIVDKQNAAFVTADRWNSLKLLSDLLSHKQNLFTKQISLKYKHFFVLKSLLESEQLLLPRMMSRSIDTILQYDPNDYPYCFSNKPIDHLLLQMLTVQDIGSKIVKGDGGLTDDNFWALALCCHVLTLPEYGVIFSEQKKAEAQASSFLGLGKSYSNAVAKASARTDFAVMKSSGGSSTLRGRSSPLGIMRTSRKS